MKLPWKTVMQRQVVTLTFTMAKNYCKEIELLIGYYLWLLHILYLTLLSLNDSTLEMLPELFPFRLVLSLNTVFQFLVHWLHLLIRTPVVLQ